MKRKARWRRRKWEGKMVCIERTRQRKSEENGMRERGDPGRSNVPTYLVSGELHLFICIYSERNTAGAICGPIGTEMPTSCTFKGRE